ncbi:MULTISPECIES: hypothetical protein [Kribbella]|jgi:hypothetical protein
MQDALLISAGVLACLAVGRVWMGYHAGELRHVKRRTGRRSLPH